MKILLMEPRAHKSLSGVDAASRRMARLQMTCENSHVSVKEAPWRRLSVAVLRARSLGRRPHPVGPYGNAAHAQWSRDSGSGAAAGAKCLRSRPGQCEMKKKKRLMLWFLIETVEVGRGQDEAAELLKSIITCFQD